MFSDEELQESTHMTCISSYADKGQVAKLMIIELYLNWGKNNWTQVFDKKTILHQAESERLAGGGEQWVDNKRKGSLPWSRLQHITQLLSLSHSWWWWWSLNSTEKKQFPGNAPGGAFNQAHLDTTAT